MCLLIVQRGIVSSHVNSHIYALAIAHIHLQLHSAVTSPVCEILLLCTHDSATLCMSNRNSACNRLNLLYLCPDCVWLRNLSQEHATLRMQRSSPPTTFNYHGGMTFLHSRKPTKPVVFLPLLYPPLWFPPFSFSFVCLNRIASWLAPLVLRFSAMCSFCFPSHYWSLSSSSLFMLSTCDWLPLLLLSLSEPLPNSLLAWIAFSTSTDLQLLLVAMETDISPSWLKLKCEGEVS